MTHTLNDFPIDLRVSTTEFFRKHIYGLTYNLDMLYKIIEENGVSSYLIERIAFFVLHQNIDGVQDMLQATISLTFSLINQYFILFSTFGSKRKQTIALYQVDSPTCHFA